MHWLAGLVSWRVDWSGVGAVVAVVGVGGDFPFVTPCAVVVVAIAAVAVAAAVVVAVAGGVTEVRNFL